MKLNLIGALFVLLSALTVFAGAADASFRTWTITEVDTAYGLMGMANATTPIIAGQGGCFALTPAGTVRKGRGFLNSSSPYPYVDRAASTDGKLALSCFSGAHPGESDIILFDNGEFSRVSGRSGNWSAISVAFDQNNNLYASMYNTRENYYSVGLFNGAGWAVQSQSGDLYSTYQYRQFVFDSYNNLVTSPWPYPEMGYVIDMAISDQDIPAVLTKIEHPYTPGQIICSVFDVHAARWVSTTLSSYAVTGDIEFDNEGNLGVALSSGPGERMGQFCYNDGSGWETSEIGSTGYYSNFRCVSLDYDIHNNPVVAFGDERKTYVAYDPIVVPEPSAVLLLLGGVCFFKNGGAKK